MDTPEISVCAPVYNEEDVVEQVVREWDQILGADGVSYEIVLTNDGSTDRTKSILTKLAEDLKNVRLYNFSENKGYGVALTSTINNSKGKYVITIDSDGQFALESYQPLFALIKEKDFDMVTGYRQKKRDRFLKVIADRALNLIVRTMFRIGLRDTNCALKIFKGDDIRGFNIEANGYPVPTELCIKYLALGKTVGELGIPHFLREKGRSKLKIVRTGFHFLVFLVFLRTKIFLHKRGVIKDI